MNQVGDWHLEPIKMLMAPSKTFKQRIIFKSNTGCGCYKIKFHCLADCLCNSKVKSQMVKEKEVNLEKARCEFKWTVNKRVPLLCSERKL